MAKLKLKNLRSLELVGDLPETSKEYLLSIVVERSGKRTDEKDIENPIDIYEMDYIRTEQMMEIGSKKKIKVQNGRTQSQVLRFTLENIARNNGLDADEYYKNEMTKIINHFSEKLK